MRESLESPTPNGKALTLEQRKLDDRTAVVAIGGDVDLISAPALKRTLYELLAGGHRQLVLDFSGVGFMDSTALGVLVGVQRRLGPEDRLAIAGAGAEVIRMFELSGVAVTFQIFPTRDAAVAYARGEETLNARGAPPLTADAALTLGLASTAMPFAQTAEEQAERWLRILGRYGEAAVVLAAIGVSETGLRDPSGGADQPKPVPETDVIATVTDHAGRIATQRGATKVGTTDLLLGVMCLYGEVFDRVLAAHGADINELAGHVAIADRAMADC